jgi:hypothetical protein
MRRFFVPADERRPPVDRVRQRVEPELVAGLRVHLRQVRGQMQRPGTDFTKLRYGRKLFGRIFILEILYKFPPKKLQMYIYLSIMSNNLGFLRHFKEI